MSRLSAIFTLPVALLCAGCGSSDGTPTSRATGSGLDSGPIFVPDNPTCADLGLGTSAYKVEPPSSGTYDLDGSNTVTVDVDDLRFDWSSGLSIDAVIVKGGPAANLYVYDPEAFSGTGLHAPINPANGSWYGLSHIELCFDYEVAVAKSASASFDRSYSWTLDKNSAVSALVLSDGQVIDVDYSVDLTPTFADGNFAVGGAVTVHNPAPFAAVLVGIDDQMRPEADPSAAVSVPLDCGITFPYVLASGATLECSYLVALGSAANQRNDVEVATSGPVGPGSASALADFSSATIHEVDECVDVSDDHLGWLGNVCAPGPHVWTYALEVGPFACGDHEFVNTASFTTNDTGSTGSDSWSVAISVPCPEGCTLTPGYWKTHSSYGPAPYDDTWALLDPNAPFFLSGQSTYAVLWTPPAGNAYYILAHAYIAAELNRLDGAAFGDAQSAFDAATLLFQTSTPAYVATLKGKVGSVLRAELTALANALDDYNNGLTGPGHCNE